MYYISFFSALIESVGYDPQRALLRVKLSNNRGIRQYEGVPEDTWYCLREKHNPDVYYRMSICGKYAEYIIDEYQDTSPE